MNIGMNCRGGLSPSPKVILFHKFNYLFTVFDLVQVAPIDIKRAVFLPLFGGIVQGVFNVFKADRLGQNYPNLFAKALKVGFLVTHSVLEVRHTVAGKPRNIMSPKNAKGVESLTETLVVGTPMQPLKIIAAV